MMKWHVTSFISLFVSCVPLAVFANSPDPDYFSRLIPADILYERDVTLKWRDVQLDIPAGTISQTTRFKLRDRGQLSDTQLPELPENYRSNQTVYSYFIDGDFSDGSITLRLHYQPGLHEERRKAIFYQSLEAPGLPWKRLETVAYPSEDTMTATLPSSSGRIVFARHRFKNEEPVEKSTFAEYGSTPYSDTAAVIDMRSGKFLYSQDARKQRSIASITKLMTSFVFLESDVDRSQLVTYTSESDRAGATLPLSTGDQLTLNDVLMATLIPSANNMAHTLSINAGADEGTFVQRMNDRANEMGLHRTTFVEPTGLDPQNVSTAGNVARLARKAFSEYAEIYQAAADYRQYSCTVVNTGQAKIVYSTNKFNGRGVYDAVAFKTGYLPGTADRTLVMQIREASTGHEVVVALLGNPIYNTIFDEAYDLADWTFRNWEFQNYE